MLTLRQFVPDFDVALTVATKTIQFPMAPLPGSLLVLTVEADKSKAFNSVNQDFSIEAFRTEASLSQMIARKVAVGNETGAIQVVLGSNTNCATRLQLFEFTGDWSWGGLPLTTPIAYTGESPPAADPTITTLATAALSTAKGRAYALFSSDSAGAPADGSNHRFTNNYSIIHQHLADPMGNRDGTGVATGMPAIIVAEKVNNLTVGGESTSFTYNYNSIATDQEGLMLFVVLDTGVPALISAQAPSGTIATGNTAQIGFTTDKSAGTAYTILTSSASNLTGITGQNIKDGMIAGGTVPALVAGNSAVTSTTALINLAGLTTNTTYHYASVHETTDGFSNILTGSFTTAGAAAGLGVFASYYLMMQQQ